MILNSIIFVCAALILSFAISQAWLATQYTRSKKSSGASDTPPQWTGSWPSVLVQLPVYNEKYVIERLLRTASQFDYPADALTIQLLDDSTDETTDIAARVIEKLKLTSQIRIEHIRRSNREGYKAGALAYGLSQSKHEFVAIFDADFMPRPDFLKGVLGYFTDPKVGMVQTRWEHLNENHSVLTRILGFAIDNHFSVEQGGRQASDCFINFNGTAGMWRRKTIDDAGGWSDDCLTEDLDLSFRAQMKGWTLLFVETITTPSELPTEMNSIRAQQSRWTKGAVETSRKNLVRLWLSGAGMKQKVVGTFHMINSSIFLPAFILGLTVGLWTLFPSTQMMMGSTLLHASLAVSFLALGFTYWISHTRGEFKFEQVGIGRFIGKYLFFMAVITGFGVQNSRAVLEGLAGKSTPFVRTPKLNIMNDAGTVSGNRQYLVSTLPIEFYLEVLVAAYFLFLCAISFYRGKFDFIDIYSFYAFGFCAIVFFSLEEQMRKFRKHAGALMPSTSL